MKKCLLYQHSATCELKSGVYRARNLIILQALFAGALSCKSQTIPTDT